MLSLKTLHLYENVSFSLFQMDHTSNSARLFKACCDLQTLWKATVIEITATGSLAYFSQLRGLTHARKKKRARQNAVMVSDDPQAEVHHSRGELDGH